MLQVFRAFDRKPLAEVPIDDATAMEAKLQTAVSVFKDRDGWLAPYERAELLRGTAALLKERHEHFAAQIAREGGKPLQDAIVEVNRAIDGLHCAADELRNFTGREVPMGLTPASAKNDGLLPRASQSASYSLFPRSTIHSI